MTQYFFTKLVVQVTKKVWNYDNNNNCDNNTKLFIFTNSYYDPQNWGVIRNLGPLLNNNKRLKIEKIWL